MERIGVGTASDGGAPAVLEKSDGGAEAVAAAPERSRRSGGAEINAGGFK